MSYIALYRKHRPLTFNEMVGQNHITDILKNQIMTLKTSHAYIFSGTRGTGKTSAAKIFARAINCLNPKKGEPCNECEACKSILQGETTDVVEMDAASNNSVDNIRAVRQEVMYSTTTLKHRVYIIDEAHMLSASAFNALLKTLEEPPENVVFILATTEEQKILPTILSRCVRFEFKKITEENILKKLEEILHKDSISYDEKALRFIASISDGAMRDALSILERCMSSTKEKITYESVVELVGSVDEKTLGLIVKGIIEYDVSIANEAVDNVVSKGKNLRSVSNSLISKFLEILIDKNKDTKLIVGKETEQLIDKIGIQRLNNIIKELSILDENLKNSNTPIIFKAKILELTTENREYKYNTVEEKIKKIELKIERLEALIRQNGIEGVKEKKEKNGEIQDKIIQKEELIDKKNLIKTKLKDFNKILERTKEIDKFQLYSALSDVSAYEEGEKIILETKNSFVQEMLRKEDIKKELTLVIEEICGEGKKIFIEHEAKETLYESRFEEAMNATGVNFTVTD